MILWLYLNLESVGTRRIEWLLVLALRLSILHAVGFFGGKWLFWNPSKIKVHILFSSKQVVTALLQHERKTWILLVVYASSTPSVRRSLWNLLKSMGEIIDLPWLVAGILMRSSLNEKRGGSDRFVDTRFG